MAPFQALTNPASGERALGSGRFFSILRILGAYPSLVAIESSWKNKPSLMSTLMVVLAVSYELGIVRGALQYSLTTEKSEVAQEQELGVIPWFVLPHQILASNGCPMQIAKSQFQEEL
jgi:hypothetical protein